MTTSEVGQKLVDLCRAGKFHEATEMLYSQDIVSVEAFAMGDAPREMKGLDAVLAKGKWWAENHEVHSVAVEGPMVAGSHFCARFTIDVTFKPADKRMMMDELAMYEVKDGKVIREEFFYSM